MKSNWTTALVWTGLAVGLTGTMGLAAEDVPVGASADLGVLSAYIWRGQMLNDETVVQPAATITKGGFSFITWGNFNLTDAATGEGARFTEIDLTLSYRRAAGPVTLGVGLSEYLFPNQTLVAADGAGVGYPGTREAFLSASLSDLPVVPSLTLYHDFGEADSTYVQASLEYSVELTDTLGLGLKASLGFGAAGYNAFYFDVDEAAMNDADFGISLNWKVLPWLTVTPAYQYAMFPDSDIESAAADLYSSKDASVFSVTVTYAF